MKKYNRILMVVVMPFMMMLTGCHPDRVEYVNIGPSESAFLVPNFGNTLDNQAKTNSAEFYSKHKIQNKVITLKSRWKLKSNGAMNSLTRAHGQYVADEVLIKVDRRPVAREWTHQPNTGTSSSVEGIEVESSNSIGFVVGIAITASISDDNSAIFLSRYKSKELKNVLDVEIRQAVESKFNEVVSKKTLAQAIKSKAEMLSVVKKEVIPYFEHRGITITNLGYKGQFTYSDPKIQQSINMEFIAEKNRVAQDKINQMNVEKAKKEAEAIRIAQTETNKMNIDKAKADAEAMRIRKPYMEMLIDLARVENEKEAIKKWNGVKSTHVLSNDNSYFRFE